MPDRPLRAPRAAFIPEEVAWRPVSPRLRTLRLLIAWAVLGPLAVGLVVAGVLTHLWGLAAGAAAPLAVGAVVSVVIGRQVRAIAYAEGPDELLIRDGALLRRLVVTPYGRLQFLDVSAGPLARAFGIARLELHTAAVGVKTKIPGLTADEAVALRERLVAMGEARMTGL
jgi:membrane protein YdbS with pleckstrin-like domain